MTRRLFLLTSAAIDWLAYRHAPAKEAPSGPIPGWTMTSWIEWHEYKAPISIHNYVVTYRRSDRLASPARLRDAILSRRASEPGYIIKSVDIKVLDGGASVRASVIEVKRAQP